ncbi:MAG: hypothetical protein COY40_03435 [Alphaproteobacteria bacterium CG_4_10_14_0_8_um_filter_53_9]|nr:MAG: hypothetical protein COY40_03435 [Alphaproteobacteria bacterium CG_4_10_14_0_8_um_filter_53_9]
MKKNITLLALAALALTGCYRTASTHGQVIYPSQLAQIKPNETTANQALQLLGTPSAMGTLNDNRWYYITDTQVDTPFKPNQVQGRSIVILDIDPSTSLVTAVNTKTEEDAKNLTPSEASTRTYGQKLGLLDQLFSNIGLAR